MNKSLLQINKNNKQVLNFIKKYRSAIIKNSRNTLKDLIYNMEYNEILNECYLECIKIMKYYNPNKRNINGYLYNYGFKNSIITLLSKYNDTMIKLPTSSQKKYRNAIKEFNLKKWESLFYEDENEEEKRDLPFIQFNEKDIDNKIDLYAVFKSLKKILNKGKARYKKVQAFLEYYLNGKTFKDLANIYGVSQTAIKDWRNEVMLKLRRELKKKGYKIDV